MVSQKNKTIQLYYLILVGQFFVFVLKEFRLLTWF